MTGDHKLDAISTYPFPIFKNGWDSLYDVNQLPIKGDIIVKNDVWFGYNSMVRNGVTMALLHESTLKLAPNMATLTLKKHSLFHTL